MRWEFEKLGIEPTRDKKIIKKAYAKLAAKYHPEEYPEEWKEIHEAYEHALKYAENRSEENTWTEQPVKKEVSQQPHKPEINFEELLFEKEREQQEAWKKERQELWQMLSLLQDVSEKNSANKWDEFLKSPQFSRHRLNEALLAECARVLKNSKISLKAFILIENHIDLLRAELKKQVLMSGYGAEKIRDVDGALLAFQQAAYAASDESRKRSGNFKNKSNEKQGRKTQKPVWIYVLMTIMVIMRIVLLFDQEPQKESAVTKNWSEEQKLFREQQDEMFMKEYLYEKYEDTDITIPDFTIKRIYSSKGEAQINGLAGYTANSDEPFVWLWEKESGNIYFDNLQQKEITEALEMQISEIFGGAKCTVEQSDYRQRSILNTYCQENPWLEENGFHTLYQQDPEEFWKEEKRYRLGAGDEREPEDYVGNHVFPAAENGLFLAAIKGRVPQTAEESLENKRHQSEETKQYEGALKKLEDSWGIQILAGVYVNNPELFVAMIYQDGECIRPDKSQARERIWKPEVMVPEVENLYQMLQSETLLQ